MKLLLTKFLLFAGALPLIIYPGIVLAGVMSLAAEWKGEELLLRVVVYSFLLGSFAYPLIYGPCAFFAFNRARKEEDRAALLLSLVPMYYLLLLVGLFATWVAMS